MAAALTSPPPAPPPAPQWDLGILVPPFSTVVFFMLVVHVFGFGFVVLWSAHSVHKHGWCRRSLRRFSYGLFTLLAAVRVAWCAVLLQQPSSSEAMRSLAAVTLTRVAFCLHYMAFSMLVCGWADSAYMMMAGRSMQQATMRKHTSLFYHIGPPFVTVNAINAILSFGTLVPLWLYWQQDPVDHLLDADRPLPPAVDFAMWLFALSGGCFSLLLAVSSMAAGFAVSCQIRQLADVEPALRSYAREKMVKVTLAAALFTSCSLSRAYVLLREALQTSGAPLGPISSVVLGVMLPELLPTVAALLVLRRQPLTCVGCCCHRRGSAMGGGGMDRWSGRSGDSSCECCLSLGCWPGRHVGGVDARPLFEADDQEVV